MATPYSVKITMSNDTVVALSNNNFSLFGFKAVKATSSGKPLVWFQTTDFSASTIIEWQENYQAYAANNVNLKGGIAVDASDSFDINLGQTLTIDGPKGTGSVSDGGLSGGISISNDTNTPFICGISEQQGGNPPTCLCAFPLFGHEVDVIVPIEKVLLTFSTNPVDTGTVIEQAFSEGFLIDLTEATDQSRAVTFDINDGWSNGNLPWATVVEQSADLTQLLVDNSAATIQSLKAA